MPSEKRAASADCATPEPQVGIIRDAALFSGHSPDTVEMFNRLWVQEQGIKARPNARKGVGTGQPVQQVLGFPECSDLGEGQK